MPISDVRKWKVHKPADEIVKTVTSKLAEKKATLLEANSRRIEARIGSETKTRFLGGIFVSKETLPVKIIMQINETAGESEIDATVQDNLGFGLKTGMVGKYKEYIQNLFDAGCGPASREVTPRITNVKKNEHGSFGAL